MKPRFWLVGAIALLLVAAIALALLGRVVSDRHQTTHLTIHHAEYVVRVCVAYHAKSGGKYPTTLNDLLRPQFNGEPFLEEWQTLDGHGKRLRFAVVVNENDEAEVFAWGERDVDGKTHLCGAKATADGTLVLFGLPE